MRLSSVFIKESITILQSAKLISNYARTYWSNNSTFNAPLTDQTDEQIHIIDTFVKVFNLFYHLIKLVGWLNTILVAIKFLIGTAGRMMLNKSLKSTARLLPQASK